MQIRDGLRFHEVWFSLLCERCGREFKRNGIFRQCAACTYSAAKYGVFDMETIGRASGS